MPIPGPVKQTKHPQTKLLDMHSYPVIRSSTVFGDSHELLLASKFSKIADPIDLCSGCGAGKTCAAYWEVLALHSYGFSVSSPS
jgi:hypothetical protein